MLSPHSLDIYMEKHMPQDAMQLKNAVSKYLSEKQMYKECEVDWFAELKTTKLVPLTKGTI